MSLAPYTTLGVGGNAEYFAEVTERGELLEVIAWARDLGLTLTVLGSGSNVLVSDKGIQGVVVRMSIPGIVYSEESDDEIFVTVSAGEDWDRFVEDTTVRGFWGLENLSGIPGTVGAAPVQNINAYGVSVGDSIIKVSGFHRIYGTTKIFSQSECCFGYRDSTFKTGEGKEYVITDVQFKLARSRSVLTEYRSSSQSIAQYLRESNIDTPTAQDIRLAILRARRNIGMLQGMYRSAGSFFKNVILSEKKFFFVEKIVLERYKTKADTFYPWHWKLPNGSVKVSTAFLMECTRYNKTDFKNKTWNGTVGLSPLHTLSIVNVHNATATDIESFADEIIKTIEKEFDICIEKEVCVLS